MDQYAVTYLPYLNMGDLREIGLGPVKVWNFDKKKDEYIKDWVLKEKLEKIFQTHVANDTPITGIGIFSIGANDFRQFNDAEDAQLRIARILMFIGFIARCNLERRGENAGHAMATAENFDVVIQRFIMGDNHISESSGEIVRFNRLNFDISQVTFQRPGFVPKPWRFDLDMDLVKMLLELQTSHPTEFEKIINASEIFMQGYYNSSYVTQNARALLQVGAFEILLNLPEQGQRKKFKELIKQYTVLAGEATFSHQSERPGGTFQTETLTKKEIWVDLFYVLRNHIIHGNTPPAAEFVFDNAQSHTDISILFLILLIRKKIEEVLPQHPCHDEIKWENWLDPLNRPLEGFVYHRSLRMFF